MGMFDTVHFKCRVCSSVIEEQSKAGDCNLNEYDAYAVPVEIAKSIEGGIIYCENCGTEYKMRCRMIINEIPMYLEKV